MNSPQNSIASQNLSSKVMRNKTQAFPHEGGVKTEAGKAVTRFNAMTHGILRGTLTEYEEDAELGILDELRTEISPQGVLENLLLERIATHYVKLQRITKAEHEFVMSVLNPRKVVTKLREGFPNLEELAWSEEIVESEGYTPKVGAEAVQRLYGVYARYETNIENRMLRAMRELRELRKERVPT